MSYPQEAHTPVNITQTITTWYLTKMSVFPESGALSINSFVPGRAGVGQEWPEEGTGDEKMQVVCRDT